jgi:hypothetical protein
MPNVRHPNDPPRWSGNSTSNCYITSGVLGGIAIATCGLYLKWHRGNINMDKKIFATTKTTNNLLQDQVQKYEHSLIMANNKISMLEESLHYVSNAKNVVDTRLTEKTRVNNILYKRLADMEMHIKKQDHLTNSNIQQDTPIVHDILGFLDLVRVPEVKMNTIDLNTHTDDTILMMANST